MVHNPDLAILTRAIKDFDRTVGKLTKAIEQANQIEIEKVRDIRVQNELAFKARDDL